MVMDTIYKDRANGKWEYYSYSDGQRVFVSKAFADREEKRKRARIIDISKREKLVNPFMGAPTL